MNLNFTRPGAEPPPPAMHVVLASQSLGRRQLLEKLGIKFRVTVARIDESTIVIADPVKMISKRASSKCDEVVTHPRVYSLDEKANTLVIAADSMAVVGKKAYGKPADRDEAREMLKTIMGKTHEFVTAVSAVYMEQNKIVKRWDKTLTTKVTLNKLSGPELELYVSRYDLTRFAASYALNETPWDLVAKVDGSYTNVIGLPMELLLPILKFVKVIGAEEKK